MEYLGHRIDANGVHTSEKKIDDILQASAHALCLKCILSCMGLLNYYAKFIANLVSILQQLYQLLQNDHIWFWSEECEKAFREAKESLARSPVLMHCDPTLPMVVAADALAYDMFCAF